MKKYGLDDETKKEYMKKYHESMYKHYKFLLQAYRETGKSKDEIKGVEDKIDELKSYIVGEDDGHREISEDKESKDKEEARKIFLDGLTYRTEYASKKEEKRAKRRLKKAARKYDRHVTYKDRSGLGKIIAKARDKRKERKAQKKQEEPAEHEME